MESQNEYNDELFKNSTRRLSQSFTKDEVGELITNAVKNNNIQQFRELMEQYDTYGIDILSNSGWNALHYACYFGFSEIAMELITKHNANANIQNREGWTPLHLCSFKGHHDCVSVLLANSEIKVDFNVNPIGTPLHCACKKNNLKVVSILLHRANPR